MAARIASAVRPASRNMFTVSIPMNGRKSARTSTCRCNNRAAAVEWLVYRPPKTANIQNLDDPFAVSAFSIHCKAISDAPSCAALRTTFLASPQSPSKKLVRSPPALRTMSSNPRACHEGLEYLTIRVLNEVKHLGHRRSVDLAIGHKRAL